MDAKQIQNLGDAFDSILRADYININDLGELQDLDGYYVDFFGVLNSILQRKDNFISGRRGTGKTTNLLRAYYECLKTISPKEKFLNKSTLNNKVLPIYIDLSSCVDIFDSNDELELIEIHFIRQIIGSLKKQLNLMFDEKFLLVFSRDNPALGDLELIEKILIEGITISNSKQYDLKSERRKSEADELSVGLSATDAKLSGGKKSTTESIQSKSVEQIRGLNIQEFLDKISEIKRKAGIDSIYVFIDEYSDLSEEAQKNFSALLKLFLGSKIGLFFKVGVITDRYDFGDKILIGRDIFPIPLDFSEYSERYNGAISAINKTQQFVKILITKRIEKFCPKLKLSDVFKSELDDIFYRITRETIGVSRTIGIILQNAFAQAASNSDPRIGLAEINYGISSARKIYQKQFTGSVKKRLVPGYYLDMWNAVLKKAVEEKNKYSSRPASHFMVDPIRKDYLSVLCENFLVHFIAENVTSKHGGKYNLYSIDYDVCIENNIIYADKKDEYTPIRFIYDSVLSKFDPYFLKLKQKSYRCPACEKIYAEEEVNHAKVKRCFEDDEKLVEIIHQEAPVTTGNFAEVEIRILGLISELSPSEALTARDIADAVGCTVQKVSSWVGKVVGKKGEIKIDKSNSPYKYYAA